MSSSSLYDTDFYAWTQQQKQLIHSKQFDKLDLINLEEEIDSMGKSEKRELYSRLKILLMHLLKWQYQTERKSNSWKNTIDIQRKDLIKHLKDNPSLKNQEFLQEELLYAYETAILEASNETGLNKKVFPVSCEWTIIQILDEEFYPS